MKLRNMVKTSTLPLVISHRNAKIIQKQKPAGKQVRVSENSESPNEKSSVSPGLKKSRKSTIETHSKNDSTQSGKVIKIRHPAARKVVEVKRAGRGKKIQHRNTKQAALNVLLTNFDSIITPKVIKNNRGKVMKAGHKFVKQKPVILSKVTPKSKKSLNSPFVKVSEIPFRIGKRSKKTATRTSSVNKPRILQSPMLTLKSLPTRKERQFASAKKSVVRKKKSLQSVKQNASSLAIEVTPIISLAKLSPKSVTSSPTIVSSVWKAAKQTTLSQSKKRQDLSRRSLSLPSLTSRNVSRQSCGTNFTSTPILAYSSYGTGADAKKASSYLTRKGVSTLPTFQRRKKSAIRQAKKYTRKQPVAAKMKKSLSPGNKIVTGLSINNNEEMIKLRKTVDITSSTYSKTSLSVVYVKSSNQSAKTDNNSLISPVMTEASETHHVTVRRNLHKPTYEVKVRKLSLPVLAKTVHTKSEKFSKRLQNNSVNISPRRNLRNSHSLKKDMKLAPTHKQKSVSYVVKRTPKRYQSRQKIKSKSESHSRRKPSKPLQSQKNIPSLAPKVKSSQKLHKPLVDSPHTGKQSEELQRKRNISNYSSLSSTAKNKNSSQSDVSISARSVAESTSWQTTPELANVTNKASLFNIKKGVQRVSAAHKPKKLTTLATGKKTSRLSKDGKRRKLATSARNVRGLSHRNIEDNFEPVKNILSQTKHSKKILSSELNRNSKDDSGKERRNLTSLRKTGSLSKVVKKVTHKPALSRMNKRKSLPAISVTSVSKNKKDNKTHSSHSVGKKHSAKQRASDIHSNKNTKLGGKLKARKTSCQANKITAIARTAINTKFNLSYPKQKKVPKAINRQKVTEISSFESEKLRNSPGENMSSKLTPDKIIPLKKSVKLSTRVDKLKPHTGITFNLAKAAEVQGNSMVTPRQTKASEPITLINKMQEDVSSASQRKIFSQSKKNVSKVVRGKMFVSEKSPKLLSKGRIKKSVYSSMRKRVSLDGVTQVEMMKWLSLEPNKELQLLPRKMHTQKARSFATSQNLTAVKLSANKKHPELSERVKIRKPVSRSQKKTRPAKTKEVERIDLYSPGQKKASEHSPKKTGKRQSNKVASNILLSKVNPKLSKQVKTKNPIVPSAKITRLHNRKEIERIGLVSPRPSLGGRKIPGTKASTLLKKKGKKAAYKPALNRMRKRKSLPAISVTSVTKNKKDKKTHSSHSVGKKHSAKQRVSDIHSNKNTKLGGKLKARKTSWTGLVSPRPSLGGRKIPATKSSTLLKKKGKKAHNKISGKMLSDKVSSDRVKRRKSSLSLPKFKGDDKAIEIENISLALPGQNGVSELSTSGYKIQKIKSPSVQKTTGRKKTPIKILSKILLKKSPKLLKRVTGKSVTPSPKIARLTKAKQIGVMSSEQLAASEPLPGRLKTQKTKISTSSKKGGKKKTINDKSKIISNKVSLKTPTRVKRRKSVSVAQKMTKLAKSKENKKFVSASAGINEAKQLSLRGYKIRKTKTSAIQKKTQKKKTEKKKTVKKKTVKQIPSKIHSSKISPNVFVKIDARMSSPITGRGRLNTRTTNLRNSLVSQRQIGKSKQITCLQENKKHKFTDFPKSASLGTMPEMLVHTRGVKSTGSASNVSFKKTKEVYTWNESPRTSHSSRNISAVRPFHLIEYASHESTPSSQFKRTRETPLMITDIIYSKQTQSIPSPAKEIAASPGKLQHIYEGLGRRSLLSSSITGSNYSQPTNRTSLEWKMTAPLDTEIAGNSYRRKDKISSFPEKARAESHIYNVSYTRNDREDLLPVRGATNTKSPQTLTKNVSYTEQRRKVSSSKVAFSLPISNVDDQTRYITSAPFPVQGKSAVSSVYVDNASNSDPNIETISSHQPLLSHKHHFTTDLRFSSPVGRSHMVFERDSDEVSVADSNTEEGYKDESEEEEKLYINREVEENEELRESTDDSDVYVKEIVRGDSKSVSQNSHTNQCIIS